MVAIVSQQVLNMVSALSNEKNIETEEVFEALEQAIQKAGRGTYGNNLDLRAEINRESGVIDLFRYREVVESVLNKDIQIEINDDLVRTQELQLGEFLKEKLPPLSFTRVSSQAGKQIVVQKIRESERRRQYEEYKDSVGEIISGIVKRVENGGVTIDLGKAEGYMRKSEAIPRENLAVGQRIKGYISEVKQDSREPQIYISRAHDDFLRALFTAEVAEIYEGTVEIVSVARDPGSRAKIAVRTNYPSIDPVGSCVGMRGIRVQSVVQELHGEKIDIVQWEEDLVTFVINAFSPVELRKLEINEEEGKIEVVVDDDKLSQAIGRRGQNVRLITKLCNAEVTVVSEEKYHQKQQQNIKMYSDKLIQDLDLDEMVAQLLIQEGFESLSDVALADSQELESIEGFDEDLVEELMVRAQNKLASEQAGRQKRIEELEIEEDLKSLVHMTDEILLRLAEKEGIKTLTDFAEVGTYDLIDEDGVLNDLNIDKKIVEEMIMKARVQTGMIKEETIISDDLTEESEGDAESESGMDAESEIGVGAESGMDTESEPDESESVVSAGAESESSGIEEAN